MSAINFLGVILWITLKTKPIKKPAGFSSAMCTNYAFKRSEPNGLYRRLLG